MDLITRIARIAAVHAAAGWAGAAVLIASDKEFGWQDAVAHSGSFKAAAVSALCALVLGRVYVAGWFKWWMGPLLGLVLGLLTVLAFYAIWPHSWQASRMEAWKTTSVVIGVYWDRLVPMAIATGAAAAWWSNQPVRPPRWARVPVEEDTADPAPSSDPATTSG